MGEYIRTIQEMPKPQQRGRRLSGVVRMGCAHPEKDGKALGGVVILVDLRRHCK